MYRPIRENMMGDSVFGYVILDRTQFRQHLSSLSCSAFSHDVANINRDGVLITAINRLLIVACILASLMIRCLDSTRRGFGSRRHFGRREERGQRRPPGHAAGRPFGRLAEPNALQIAAN